MIDQRKALMRQLQQMFHEHLLGLYTWDQFELTKPKEAFREPGRPREAGKFRDEVTVRLGPFVIEVLGPSEDLDFPCGRARIMLGKRSLDGPLDATTWTRIAGFIKEHRKTEEENHGAADWGSTAGSDWGR